MFAAETHRGADIIPLYRNAGRGELSGFIDGLDLWAGGGTKVDIVPLCSMECFSAGRMTSSAHEELQGILLDAVKTAGRLDAVLISLHGACVSDLDTDVEGHTLERVRAVVGGAVPIVCTLDLHCNITDRMVTAADVLVPYHTTPHIDMYETGLRAVVALRRMLGMPATARTLTAFVKLPMILPVERANTQATAAEMAAGTLSKIPPQLLASLAGWEKQPWCLGAGVSTTQPWLDVPEFGSAVVVSAAPAAGTAEAAATARTRCIDAAEGLARLLVDGRDDYMPQGSTLMPYPEAVATAHRHATASGGLVVIGDGPDATTSGAPGDSTWLIGECAGRAWPRGGACIPMISPTTVQAAMAVGAGQAMPAGLSLGKDRATGSSRAMVLPAGSLVERVFRAKFQVKLG